MTVAVFPWHRRIIRICRTSGAVSRTPTSVVADRFRTVVSALALRTYVNQGVANIAALRALTSGANVVIVEGYYSAGDGGGGVYTLGSPGTDNGGTVIVSPTGTWYLNTQGGPFTVRQFGATGDGVTDDTAAIQRAVNAAQVNGGAIYFAGGCAGYKTTAPIMINTPRPLYLVGDGAIIFPPINADAFVVTTSSLGVVVFQGLVVIYNSRTSTSGVTFKFLQAGVRGSGVQDCRVLNGYALGNQLPGSGQELHRFQFRR